MLGFQHYPQFWLPELGKIASSVAWFGLRAVQIEEFGDSPTTVKSLDFPDGHSYNLEVTLEDR